MTINIDPVALAHIAAQVLVCLILLGIGIRLLLCALPDCVCCYRIGFLPIVERHIGRPRLRIYCRRCWLWRTR